MKNYVFLVFFIILSCHRPKHSPIEQALQSVHPAIINVAYRPDLFELQILYTQIDTNESGQIVFTDYQFGLNEEAYFYPASTVKLPAAVLAMEFADAHSQISGNTLYTSSRDSLSHTLFNDAREILSVSDNDAYNRLYELLGRDYINDSLSAKGISPVRIAHRLATNNAMRASRDTISFILPNQKLHFNGKDSVVEKIALSHQLKGAGFISNDSLIKTPMDFSKKNYYPLRAQHQLIKRLFFPTKFPPNQRFKISEESKKILFSHMHRVPRLSGYEEDEYYDSYGKFFIYGDSKERIPEEIKIYNKVGYAYGTLTDTAYITNVEEGIEFLLSATILVNKNNIFNDDSYQYEEVGIPFLAQLGREIYLYEATRDRD